MQQRAEAYEKAKKDRMNALKVLTKEQMEYQQVKNLKEQLESLLRENPTNKEADQALKWVHEFLREPDPLTSFLKNVINPLMDGKELHNT